MGNHLGFRRFDDSAAENLGDFVVLPPECLYHILLHCDGTTIAKLSEVNHLFHDVTSDPRLWETKYVKDFGFPKNLQDYSRHELVSLPWKQLYGLKMTKRRNPMAPINLQTRRHWFVSLLIAFCCLCAHVPLLIITLALLVGTLATLSHRSLYLIRSLYDIVAKEDDESNLFDSQVLWAALTFDLSNPWLQMEVEIWYAFALLFWDAVCLLTVPFLGWYLCLLSLWRAPLVIVDVWCYKAPIHSDRFTDAAGLSWIVCAQLWFLVVDVLFVPLLLLPLLLTVHRLPFVWIRLKGMAFDDWVNARYVEILVDEFKAIGSCAERGYYMSVEEGDVNRGEKEYRDIERATESDEEEITVNESKRFASVKKRTTSYTVPMTTPTTASTNDTSLLCTMLFDFICLVGLITLGLPAASIILLSLSHQSIHLVYSLHYLEDRCLMNLIDLLVRHTRCFCLEIFCFMCFPFICFWLVCLTVYRLPLTVSQIIDSAKQKKDATNVSFIPVVDAGYILLDAFTFVFVFLPLLLTVHRVPSLFRRFSSYETYSAFLAGWRSDCFAEIYLIGTCDDNYHQQSEDHRPRSALQYLSFIWKVLVLVVIGIYLLGLSAIAIPMAIVTLCTISQRSIELVADLYYHWHSNATLHEILLVMLTSILLVLWDLVCYTCLPFLGWWIVVLTLYRVPLMVKHIWTSSQKKKKWEDCFNGGLPAFIQGLWVVCDIVMVCLFVPPIIVTVHRVPSLLRTLRAHSYDQLFGKLELYGILWEEFKNIGSFEPSERERLIAGIIED